MTMTQTAIENTPEFRVDFSAESSIADQESLQELVLLLSKQRSRLSGFVRKHLRREDLIEDVVQQTYLEAYRNWGNFRGESKAETWLFGIAFNLLRNFRAKQGRIDYVFQDSEDDFETVAADQNEQPHQLLMRKQRIEQLRQGIESLPLKMQSVVELVLLQGYAYQDAADELGLPIGTVRSRLSRARDALTELMQESV